MTDLGAFDAFEAAGWERRVAGYDDFFRPITSRLVVPLLDAAGVTDGSRVLDVGSGPGYVAAGAVARGASVVGVDVAGSMVALARARVPEAVFVEGRADDLPAGDASFDAVTAGFVLLHIGRPEAAVAEFARVLAPGGRLALTVWDVPARARFIGVMLDAVAAAGVTPPASVPAGPPMFRFSDEDEMRALLTAWVDVRVETVSFPITFASADALWDGVVGGTVRVSPLIAAKPDAVRAAFDRIVGEEGLELDVSVKLASARSPLENGRCA